MTALVAGHETTASQLAWAFERLAREPRVVARAGRGDRRRRRRRVPDRDHQRDPAAAPGAAQRRAAADQAADRDRRLPLPGRRRRCWPAPTWCTTTRSSTTSPYAFRPERFVGNPPGTYTWIPFGGGRRRCLGASFAMQEMKIVLRAVIARYRLSPAGARPENTARRGITFSPGGRATVVLHERERAPAPSRSRSPPSRAPPTAAADPRRSGALERAGAHGRVADPHMDLLAPLHRFDTYQQRHRWRDPDGGGQEVRRRPGRQPGGAGRLLRLLLAVPAAAGVRHDPRVRAAGRPQRPAGGRELGAQPVPDHRRPDPRQRAARAAWWRW